MKKLTKVLLYSILSIFIVSAVSWGVYEVSPWKTRSGDKVGAADKIWTGGYFEYLYLFKDASIISEGDTEDAYETTLSFVEPTADNTLYIPNDSGMFLISELTSNAPDAANSIWGESNKLAFEGATANAFETFLTVTDPTAARTITFPNASGTVMLGLTSGESNSVEFGNSTIVFEGATKDAYETTLTVEEPTADRTITVPDYSGAVPLIVAQGYTTTSSGETSVAIDVTGSSITLPDGWFSEGKALKFKAAGTVTGSTDTISVLLYFEDASVMTLTTTDGAAGDWSAEFIIAGESSTSQRITGSLIAEGGAELKTDYATDNTDISAAGTIPVKLQTQNASGETDITTTNYVLIETWSKTD